MDWTALLTDLITPVATLGGVVLTLYFTGRREERRTERTHAFERAKLLVDERRLLFIKAAHAFQRMRDHLDYRGEEQVENGMEAWENAVTKSADNLKDIATELTILAPQVAPHVRHAVRHALAVRDVRRDTTEEEINQALNHYRTEVLNATGWMQEVLGVEPTPNHKYDPGALERIRVRKVINS